MFRSNFSSQSVLPLILLSELGEQTWLRHASFQNLLSKWPHTQATRKFYFSSHLTNTQSGVPGFWALSVVQYSTEHKPLKLELFPSPYDRVGDTY
jgi:hypothetical protein